MLGISSIPLIAGGALPLGQAGGISQTPQELFQQIFVVFTFLGTLVGVVVTSYMLWKAYKYRYGTGRGAAADDDKKVVRPQLGEIPGGSGGGKKLFLSFGISAVIVLSLIVWTYSALLYVETTPEEQEPDMTVEVVGEQYAWQFHYPNGYTSYNELVVPEGAMIELEVSTNDVFHNFGIPAFRAKADAMPGHTTDTWFVADEQGTYQAHCYELCGSGHSGMDAEVRVVSQQEYEQWLAENSDDGNTSASLDADASASLIDATAVAGGGA